MATDTTSVFTLKDLAILLSPILAVLITLALQDRKEKHNHKLFILGSLMATRHAELTDENVRALNMIDMVFSDKRKIRDLWQEYYVMLNTEGLNNETGWAQWKSKRLELITEMAKSLGYGSKLSHLDVARVYNPKFLGAQAARSEAIANQLLEVLKKPIAVVLQDKPKA